MALVRALNAAISGLRAEQFRIDTIGDNLANSTTTGFKSGRAEFETLLSQTLAFGTAPQGFLGGVDPVQLGLGVKIGDTSRNFSQGSLSATGVASDLAIEGDGFFVMNDQSGAPVYTRDGTFTINPANFLHDPSHGFMVQGFMADFTTFQIQSGGPAVNVQIPVGNLRIAQATSTATYSGNLNGGGAIANAGTILESEQFLFGGVAANLNSPLAGLQRMGAGGPVSLGIAAGSTLEVSAEKGGRILPAKRFAVSATPVPGTDDFGATVGDFVDFLNDALGINRVSATSSYSSITRRVTPAGTVFGTGSVQTGEAVAFIGGSTTVAQYASTPTTGPAVDFRALGAEEGDFLRITSGPAAGQIAQITFIDSTGGGTNNRLTVSGFDATLPLPAAGAQWEINEYSRVSMGARPTTTGVVALPGDAVAAGAYTKPGTDFAALGVVAGDAIAFDTGGQVIQSVIASIGGVGNSTLTFTAGTNIPAGALPSITNATPWSINGTPMFSELLGTDAVTTTSLTRAGKNWLTAGVFPASFIRFNTPTGPVVTTVASDMTQAELAGGLIRFGTALTAAPAAGSLFRIDGKMDAQEGAGRIRIDGNVGNANRIANLQMRVVNGASLSTLTELASAAGESVISNATFYDSLGTPHVAELTFALQSKSDRGNRFTYLAEAEDDSDLDRVIGSGFVDFNPDGSFRAQSPQASISIDLANSGANTPLVVTPNLAAVTGFSNQRSEVALTDQDGFAQGTLTDFSVGTDGVVTGIFSNGLTRSIAQVILARFNNPNGLEHLGSNQFRAAANSGLAVTGTPGSFGRGTIRSGFLEESNVDIARQFTDLIVAQRSFQANARTIRVSDELLQDLVQIV